MTRVLVVDDEQAILDAVRFALEREGFDVTAATDGVEGLRLAREAPPDVVVLDVLLPGMSGREVCRVLRAESSVPIVMLSARGDPVDRVVGLELGADDYMTKPFALAELVARVNAQLRRRTLDDARTALRVGGLELDLARREAIVNGQRVSLTESEARILETLARTPGVAVARELLVHALWDTDFTGSRRAIDAHVVNLRRKIGAERVVTVRGVGYALV